MDRFLEWLFFILIVGAILAGVAGIILALVPVV